MLPDYRDDLFTIFQAAILDHMLWDVVAKLIGDQSLCVAVDLFKDSGLVVWLAVIK